MEDTTWQMVVEGFANDLTYARSEGYREVTKANRVIIKSAGPDNDTVQLVVPGKLSDNPAFDATPEVIEPGRTIYSLKFMGLFSEDKS